MSIKFFGVLSKLEKTIFVGAGVLAIVSGVVLGALYADNNTFEVAARGGILREGLVGQPVFINPIIPLTDADREISRVVFSGLSDLAESIKPSEDGRVWTVRLKENILWHDGEEMTSDDAIFTLETILNKEAHSPLYQSFKGVTAERVSQLEIKFSLQSPYAFFEEEHLAKLAVIPKHIFGDLPVQNFRLSIYGLNPVGTGPYQVVSFNKDNKGVINSIRLKANKNYLADVPNISDLYFQFYKDEDALVAGYNSGEINSFILSSSEKLNLTGDSKTAIKVKHKLYSLNSSRYYAIFINQALGDKALKNIKVRQALSQAIDRDALITNVFGSYVKPAYGPTILTSKPAYVNDPATLSGLNLTITLPEEEFIVKTANIIKADWEAKGATVTLIPLSLKNLQEKVLKNTDYSMILFGNTSGESNDLFSFWHSSQRFYPDQNLALYQNKKVDALLESYRKDMNPDNRTTRLKTISDTIAGEYPGVFLYSPDYIYIATPRLHGLDNTVTIGAASDRFKDIEKWYIETRRVWQ